LGYNVRREVYQGLARLLVVRSMKGLLTDSQTEQLLMIKADSALATIIQTFENRTTEQS
jgi:hypothetical protein